VKLRLPQTSCVFVVLTAIELEYMAVRAHLDGWALYRHHAGTIFESATLTGTDWSVVIARTGAGNVGAAIIAERAIAMFKPELVLLVGIAGSLNEDVQLGHVVVATKVYAYHGGKDQAEGFQSRPEAWLAPHDVEQMARHVATTSAWTAGLETVPPVHFRPIAAGEVVLNSRETSLAEQLRRSYNDAAAVEMESAGVSRAGQLNRSQAVLTIRGISDRADGHKVLADEAGWPSAAAANAAAFAFGLLREFAAAHSVHIADVAPILIGSIPPRAGFFQTRPVAQDLVRAMQTSPTAVISQVLTGLGGVGKTQLAADYARGAWQSGDIDLVVWITATSRENIISGYADAADAVDGGHRDAAERAAQRFLRWLASPTRSTWLIVFDDLAQPSVLDGLWPPPARLGRTIVTTRRRDAALVRQGWHMVEVGLFTDAEATGYLRSVLHDHPDLADDLNGLAADLGYIPLALSHAAAFMIDRQLTCSEYRLRFRDQHRRLADLFPEPESLPDQYQHTVGTTWSLSIDVADGLYPIGVARPLLELAAVLDPNGTPRAVFATEAARAWVATQTGQTAEHDADNLRDGLFCLQRLNLVAVDENVVHVHALVQRAVCEALGPRSGSVRRAAATALLEAWTVDLSLGWPTASTLVKVASEEHDDTLLRHIFDRLLGMLDGRETESVMHRAWDATYVIEDNFTILLPLVLEALQLEPLENPAGPSRLREGITQAAANSLAASFNVVLDPATADPTTAIPILGRALRRWALRKRFVEALAMYQDPRALVEILNFAREELRTGGDVGIFGALATAIGTLVDKVDPARHGPAIKVLKEIAAMGGLDLKTTRAVRTSLARLEQNNGQPSRGD
jgi:nucleoside phosphorylase